MALSLFERRLKSYRSDLLQEDSRVRDMLHAAYAQAKDKIEERLKALYAQGVDPERFDAARLAELLSQIDEQLARLAAQAEGRIAAGQQTTARLGAQQALGLVEAQAPGLATSFSRLPVGSIETMVGTLSDGSLLRSLLNQQGLAVGDEVRRLLTTAIAMGKGPREVSRELRQTMNRSRWRSEVLARNALLDANRLASLQIYAQNGDILSGWTWVAALSSRTCLACLALHGTEFPLTEQFFPRHPACRCSPAPLLRADLAPPPFEPGDQWLSRQSIATQQKMIPVALWGEYRDGSIRLEDFVTETYSSRWGRSFRQAIATEVREHASRRGRRVAA